MPGVAGRRSGAALFGARPLDAWAQVALAASGRSDDPPALVALQCVVGAAGAAAAWGSWRGARWAPAAAAAYGVITAAMIASLEALLDLGADARGGLLTGAAVVLLLALAAAWYLRRTIGSSRVGAV